MWGEKKKQTILKIQKMLDFLTFSMPLNQIRKKKLQ